MKITSSNPSGEAREALDLMNGSINKVYGALRREGATYLLIWGSVYLLVPLTILFVSHLAHWLANGIIIAGVTITIIAMTKSPVRSPLGSGMIWFFGILFFYAFVWLSILGGEGFPEYHLGIDSRQTWGFGASIGLLYFVLAGLISRDKLMVMTGLIVTGILLAAYFVAWEPRAFWAWMALGTGLPLLIVGFYSKFALPKATV